MSYDDFARNALGGFDGTDINKFVRNNASKANEISVKQHILEKINNEDDDLIKARKAYIELNKRVN